MLTHDPVENPPEERPEPDAPYTIYLLHFAEPVSGKSHYTGITATARLEARMLDHAQGFGSNLTREAFKQNVKVFLVRTWPAQSYAEERTHKRNGHARRRCPMCTDLIHSQPGLPRRVVPAIYVLNLPGASLNWKQK
jgi:predicted GIY-YIG superfamily endonuclease